MTRVRVLTRVIICSRVLGRVLDIRVLEKCRGKGQVRGAYPELTPT
jgi:hypothetical protein